MILMMFFLTLFNFRNFAHFNNIQHSNLNKIQSNLLTRLSLTWLVSFFLSFFDLTFFLIKCYHCTDDSISPIKWYLLTKKFVQRFILKTNLFFDSFFLSQSESQAFKESKLEFFNKIPLPSRLKMFLDKKSLILWAQCLQVFLSRE